MTCALWGHIHYRARTQPHAIATIHSRGTTTYERLERDVDGLSTMLLEMGLADEALVGLHFATSFTHLRLILALDRLGIPSFSFPNGTDASAYPGIVNGFGLSVVLSSQPAPDEPPCRWVRLQDDDRPIAAAADLERLARFEERPDGLVRVIGSSGTTGIPKAIPLSGSIAMNRFKSYQWSHDLNGTSRHLCALGLASSYTYMTVMSVLVAGGTIVFSPPSTDDIFSLAETVGITSISVVPSLLDALIGLARERGRRLDTVKRVEWGGNRLPGKVAQEARQFLTHNLHSAYGSSEAGMVALANASLCIADPLAVGYLLPWMEVQVADDSDRPLPPNAEGHLRMKGNTQVAGYHRNPEATARVFRDGWFYPGDIASISPLGVLRIVGRADDIIHYDGNKIAPAVIEDYFRKVPGIRDVAAFSATNARGFQEIAVAVVVVGGVDLRKIGTDARTILGEAAPARLMQVDALPRNDLGKVLIRELVALAGRS